MGKVFFLDTNILLEDPNSIDHLSENGENQVLIPYSCILELDRLKKNLNKSHLVTSVMDKLSSDKCPAKFIRRFDFSYSPLNTSDETILADVADYLRNNKEDNYCFISNDRILRLRVKEELKIYSQEYRQSQPFLSDSEIYTGVIKDGDEYIKNCFYWREGKLFYEKGEKLIDYENELWKIKPRTPYQNMLMELLLDKDIDVVSVQSAPGHGKTFLTLAAALQLVFQKEKNDDYLKVDSLEEDQPKKKRGRKKKPRDSDGKIIRTPKIHRKIYVVRPTITIGEELGFLPGDLSEKLDPYFRPIRDLLLKLHEIRPCNRLFVDGDPKKGFDPNQIEFLPINYLRGMNIENAIIIGDEMQNLTRLEIRTLLSRMGEGVRCFLTGDTSQIDHKYLNPSNNGLNWVLRKFKNQPNYAHITLKGPKSRGPIADLVIKTGL